MILDRRDYEILRLCGLCRYLPTGLHKKYDSEYFAVNVFYTLQERGFIKQQSDGSSYKLTYDGRVVLAEMGYTFAEDARLDLKRPAYRRRLKNALWNAMLFLAGIDIYFENMSRLAENDIGYLSSLMLRTDNNLRVLAGTRFLGILKIHDTVYVPYHIESENDWIVPGYEREIFSSEISRIHNNMEVQLILTGNSLEELWRYIAPEFLSDILPRGMQRFDRGLEEIGYDYSLVPLSRDGVVQLSIMRINGYRKRIAAAIGCTSVIPVCLSECDGIADDTPYIIAIDINVKRIVRALHRCEKYSRDTTPKVCCFKFQRSTIFKLLRKFNISKCVVLTIESESISEIFPEMVSDIKTTEPYVTEKGEYIDANERKVKKADIKALKA